MEFLPNAILEAKAIAQGSARYITRITENLLPDYTSSFASLPCSEFLSANINEWKTEFQSGRALIFL
jgi:hypothetical protein